MEGVETSTATHVELSTPSFMVVEGTLSILIMLRVRLLFSRVMSVVILGTYFGELRIPRVSILHNKTHLLSVVMLIPFGEGAT